MPTDFLARLRLCSELRNALYVLDNWRDLPRWSTSRLNAAEVIRRIGRDEDKERLKGLEAEERNG